MEYALLFVRANGLPLEFDGSMATLFLQVYQNLG